MIRLVIAFLISSGPFASSTSFEDLAGVRSEEHLDEVLAAGAQLKRLFSLCERQLELESFPGSCYQPQVWQRLGSKKQASVDGLCIRATQEEVDLEKIQKKLGNPDLAPACRQEVERRLQQRIYQLELSH